ncbi:MAG: DUF4070 domain-containing protein [Rhodospirillales bacterium]
MEIIRGKMSDFGKIIELRILIYRFDDESVPSPGTGSNEVCRNSQPFFQSAPIPIFSIGTLIAPAQTPLYTRLAAEGRLLANESSYTTTPWHTNIVPKQMSRESLIAGVRQLSRDVYCPEAFAERA